MVTIFLRLGWDAFLSAMLRLGLLSCFLLPLLMSPDTVYPFNVGKSVFFRTAVDLMFPLWVFLAVRNAEHRPRAGVVLIALLAYAAATVLAALFGADPAASFWSTHARSQGVVEFLHFTAFAVMAAAMFRPGRWREALVWTNVGVNVAVMGFGMFCYLFFPWWPFLAPDGRLHSTLGQPTYFSAYCTFSALVALVAWSGMRDWFGWHRRGMLAAGLAALVLLNLWGVYLAAGRMSVLSVVVVAVFCGVAFLGLGSGRGARWAGALAVGAALSAVLAVALVMATDRLTVAPDDRENLANRFSRTLTERDNSARGRLAAVRTGLLAYADRPVLGWGPELFDYGWVRHVTVREHNGRIFDQAHNKLVEVAATTGTVGLLAYLALVSALCRVFFRLLLRERAENLARAVFTAALLVNYLVTAMFLFDTTVFMMTFAAVLTLAMLSEPERTWGFPRGRMPAWARVPDINRAAVLRGAATLVLAALVSSASVLSIYHTAGIRESALHRPESDDPIALTSAYARSLAAFPAMAAQFRIDFTLLLLPMVDRMTAEQKRATLPYLVEQVQTEAAARPDYWRIHYVAVVLYTVLSGERDDFEGQARRHWSRLAELSPDSFYTADAERVMRQHMR